MQPTTPAGQRHHPTLHHAQVLGDAFGYALVPEPSSLFLLGSGIVAVLVARQRCARDRKGRSKSSHPSALWTLPGRSLAARQSSSGLKTNRGW